MTQTIDESKLEQLMGQMVGHMTGAALCFGVWLGDELGLYTTLTDLHEATADELADETGCNRRLCASGSTDRWRVDSSPGMPTLTATGSRRRRRWRSPTTPHRCSSRAR